MMDHLTVVVPAGTLASDRDDGSARGLLTGFHHREVDHGNLG